MKPSPLIDWEGLATELGVRDHEHVAIVGGGGKTTLMFALSSQLGGTRIVTTTTKMGADQNFGRLVIHNPSDDTVVVGLGSSAHPGEVVIWDRVEQSQRAGTDYSKAVGVSPAQCDYWFSHLVDHVLVEADGARRKPFKAPKTGEPVVPATATMMVIVMGADALGRVIIDQCHRPLRVAALAGCQPSDRLSPQAAARVLAHQRGFIAHQPVGARLAVVITKVDDTNQAAAQEVAATLGPSFNPIMVRSQ